MGAGDLPDGTAPPVQGARVDWEAVRHRMARRNAELWEVFDGRGPWADAVLERRAAELAERPDAPDAKSTGIPMLVARGEATVYGLELRHLGHIVPMPRLARVPGAAPAVLGVIAVAGRVMRLFDLDRLCGGVGATPGGEGSREDAGYAVVLRMGGARPAALRVSAVDRVADIEPPRADAPEEAGQFVKAITKDRMAILDMGALLEFVKS